MTERDGLESHAEARGARRSRSLEISPRPPRLRVKIEQVIPMSYRAIALSLWLCAGCTLDALAADPLPSLKEAVASKSDLWAELAIQQPNGASYEFFEPLL